MRSQRRGRPISNTAVDLRDTKNKETLSSSKATISFSRRDLHHGVITGLHAGVTISYGQLLNYRKMLPLKVSISKTMLFQHVVLLITSVLS